MRWKNISDLLDSGVGQSLRKGYTEDEGLSFFNCATASTNGIWWYVSALDSMRAKLCFRCHSVNIGPSYTQ